MIAAKIYLLVVISIISRNTMICSSQCLLGDYYLPQLATQYFGDDLQRHIISVVAGQDTTVSCQMMCPNSSFTGCENDIEADWLVLNPNTYEVFSINSVNEGREFTTKYGMAFSSSRLSADECLTSGHGMQVQSLIFTVTFNNFNATLKDLLVICGLKRPTSGASIHAIKLFALLKLNYTMETPTITSLCKPVTPTATESSTLPTITSIKSPTTSGEPIVSKNTMNERSNIIGLSVAFVISFFSTIVLLIILIFVILKKNNKINTTG